MVLIQIITVLIVLFFFLYLVHLMVFDLFLLAINAVLIYYLLVRMLRAFQEGLQKLYVAVGLIVLLVMFIVPFSNAPLYKITWFLVLTHLGAQASAWAHKKGYIDLAGLIDKPQKQQSK